ncbi:isoprenylcysteine carboxylmethyltransferase family protein [bacterium]|nr:MAG: isoprenylcysteine carboxylmethyltransferase family protein [bacterium]
MPDLKLTKFICRWRVRAGTLGVLGVIIFARPTWKPLLAGFGLSLLGLGLRTWAAGHLKKEKVLAVSGPYRRTRNPLYLGSLLIGVAMAVGAWSWGAAAILVAYFLVFYPVVINEERKRMKSLFPVEYETYRKRVPLFFASFRKAPAYQSSPFSRALYRKNKEQRALIGTIVFWIVLIARMYFPGP